MTEANKSTQYLDVFVKSISKARFESYRSPGQEDKEVLCKYVWNLLLCESLCPGFQILEVAFRNSVHSEISRAIKDDHWLSNKIGILYEFELDSIKTAMESIRGRRKPVSEDALIAEMGFGFWTSLLDARYETLWPKIIKGVFPNMPNSMRTRGEASKMANPVRKLRNAALHHHSIWHWADLTEQHEKMIKLIGYICSSSHALALKIDRFPSIFQSGHKNCENLFPEI